MGHSTGCHPWDWRHLDFFVDLDAQYSIARGAALVSGHHVWAGRKVTEYGKLAPLHRNRFGDFHLIQLTTMVTRYGNIRR